MIIITKIQQLEEENLVLKRQLKKLKSTVAHLRRISETKIPIEKNSDQNLVLKEFKDERDFFLKAFDAFKDGVYVVDENENIQYVNPVLETEFGPWKGKKCYDYFHGGTERCSFCKMEQVLAGETVKWEWYSDKNNKTFDLIDTLIVKSDGTKCKLEVFRDITEQKLLNRLKSQRNESIALLAGKIANDFNNLLASIIGNVSLIQMSDTLDAELMENAGEIEEAALRAKTLANQLLTFSKGGSPVKKVQPIDLILSNSLSLAMSGSRTKLNLHSTETLPWVNVDEGQLSQVFKNLTTNSLHAMRDSGTLDIFLTSKMIGNADNIPLDTGNYLKISFRDTGSGIAQQQQHLIFQPYFTTKTHGIGLGLATSYSIIKKHGGIMTFESEKSKGTTFYIYLPTVPQPLPEIEPSNTLDLIKNEQILLLEDEPIVYKMLQKILIKMGFSVDITEDGADTITKYKMKYEDKQPYALVILDLTIIGGMGGEKTVKEIRKINPNVKAIVSSGYSNDDVLANFEDYGFCDILTKPYSLAELQNKILKVLNSR